jgi:transcriptional regulator with XRE-family HTH domain
MKSGNKELIKKIGKNIFTLRQSKGLSREELAFRIGICQQQLFKYETGANRITVDRLINIAEALDAEIINFWPQQKMRVNNILNCDKPNNHHAQNDVRNNDTVSYLNNSENNLLKLKKLSGDELVFKIMELITHRN